MLKSELRENLWTVSLDGRLSLLHSGERPFVTALRREKSYKAKRGTVKEEIKDVERCPLTALRQEGERLLFTGNGRRLALRMEEIEQGVRLELEGEEGWAYEFCLPAITGEGVFGVSFDHPLTSVYDYASAVRQNAPHGLVIPAGRDTPSTGEPELAYPLTVFGWDCEPTLLTAKDIL